MKTGKWSIQKLIYTAMLAAVAGVLMSLEFSVPMMPPFYKVDFSDVPSVIAVFLMGPVSGICVEVIKLLIKLITVGTNTMYVGELANLIAAFLFVWPLWFLYQKLGANRKAAVEALLISIVIRTACACFINANITLPLYAKAMSLPLDEVIRMVASVNPAIKDLNGFIILATIPFNVLKVGLNYIVGQLLFVRLRAAKIVPKAV
ncbi:MULTISPECIES: ECF transporter S component [Clostridium]|jgi:riboflavin transporter FmnP|uniref:ECF transporter S component n=1 Tax=Clostridium TaxID=1485 RepID=UPI000E4C998C|nr:MULTISPECIES: ECF transporter S component [Clostridium]RHV75535.1 ECF transporter S component [Clostridium sp. OF13-4]MCC2169738.1 ECF transporter S component [Clostridium fessum]RGH13902.1 ECF transporter S component [Clostridium sp. AF12-41]RHP40184.1 ECF transporter S component [Clostridium sp. AF32-7AC]RHQ67232.1 ECF transporter S component [Clostridium sp. AF24-2LB]